MSFIVSSGFKKHRSSHCRLTDTFGSDHHLKRAQAICQKDNKCVAIQDEDCDNKGPFLLCKQGFITKIQEYSSSCIFEKLKNIGMVLKTKSYLCRQIVPSVNMREINGTRFDYVYQINHRQWTFVCWVLKCTCSVFNAKNLESL